MWKWLGFTFGLASLGLFAVVIVFSDFFLANATASWITTTAFLVDVVISWAILIAVLGHADDRYTRGFAWISGISIFVCVLAWFFVEIGSQKPLDWMLVIESLIVGATFGVPISVSILLIINTFRKYKTT